MLTCVKCNHGDWSGHVLYYDSNYHESLCVKHLPLITVHVALTVLVLKVMSAHDKGSHAEVEVKVKKVLYRNPLMKIQKGSVTLYPESWTIQGCTCPILNPGQLQSLPLRCLIANNAEAYMYYYSHLSAVRLFYIQPFIIIISGKPVKAAQ